MTGNSKRIFALSGSTGRSRWRVPTRREGPILPRQQTPEYLTSRSLLSPGLQVELDLLEDEFAIALDHRRLRKDRVDGSVVDLSAARAGLLVADEMVDGETAVPGTDRPH